MRAKELTEHVIKPILKDLSRFNIKFDSKAAQQLMLGTAIQESKLEYLRQINGPALGLWQMEPATEKDIFDNYLNSSKRWDLLEYVLRLKGEGPNPLVYNLGYACVLTRIHYFRVKEKLPMANDIEGQAAYWKKYYNTSLGKGTEEEYVRNWSIA